MASCFWYSALNDITILIFNAGNVIGLSIDTTVQGGIGTSHFIKRYIPNTKAK